MSQTQTNTNKNEKSSLTQKERAFLNEYFQNGFNGQEAYQSILPTKILDNSARYGASKMLKRIKMKVEWREILAEAGLDDMRLAVELSKRLEATKAEFYQGKQVAVLEDNATRMKATELLAELLGRKKAELDLNLPTGGVLAIPGMKSIADWEAEGDVKALT